jgi:hypothetical protein
MALLPDISNRNDVRFSVSAAAPSALLGLTAPSRCDHDGSVSTTARRLRRREVAASTSNAAGTLERRDDTYA